jgi:hypothetical protein
MKKLLTMTLLLLIATSGWALPRYSARYGQACILCHENLSGGGIRTAYASQFLVPQELAASIPSGSPLDLEIAPGVHLGGDLRTLVSRSNQDRTVLVTMQTDLYVGAQLDDRTSVVFEQTRSGVGEAYGTARILPVNGYLRAGRFEPAYGWRFADHQLLVRRHLLAPDGAHDPGRLISDGVELGFRPGSFVVQASVLPSDGEHGESHAVRAVGRASIGPVNLALGGSSLRHQSAGRLSRTSGLFGYVATSRWSWLWQVDESRIGDERGLLMTHEATVTVLQGVDLRGTYSHQDPDQEYTTGARERWSLGIDSLVTPNLGLVSQLVREKIDPGPRVEGPHQWSAEMVFHILF